ncbi:hypothetical protein ACLOJK_008940 [Asimina triloba]
MQIRAAFHFRPNPDGLKPITPPPPLAPADLDPTASVPLADDSGPPSAADPSNSIRRTMTRGCTDRTHQPVVSSQIPISASDATSTRRRADPHLPMADRSATPISLQSARPRLQQLTARSSISDPADDPPFQRQHHASLPSAISIADVRELLPAHRLWPREQLTACNLP